MSSADVCARESAWLNTTGDTLPSLSVAHGGPWGVIQAYWPGAHLATQKTGIYVLRRSIAFDHPLAIRYRWRYELTDVLIWPVRATTPGIAETEQAAFDAAIGLLAQRVMDLTGDKTHGGRFLSVGEVPAEQPVTVELEDPTHTLVATKDLRATMRYYADDFEVTG